MPGSKESNTWTACLSGEMMLREVDGAWVHVVLQELTVAMVMAADDGVGVPVVLLVSVCFSADPCLSISRSNTDPVMGKVWG